jgi:hypothetical protein
MKKNTKFIPAAVLFCLMFLIQSCSSSVLVNVWNDPSYHDPPLKKILVIAIRKDAVQRRIWEDAFTSEFSRQGVKAISSYSLFPDALPDTDQVVGTVLKNGFDGILISSHLSAGARTHYVESYVTLETNSKFNPFTNSYSIYYRDVEHPGYTDSLVVKRHAIDFWITKDGGRMIWGATSDTPELNTVEDIHNDVAVLVIDDLTRDDIIKSNK